MLERVWRKRNPLTLLVSLPFKLQVQRDKLSIHIWNVKSIFFSHSTWFLIFVESSISVLSLSCVRLFVTPRTAAQQASLTINKHLKFTQIHLHQVSDVTQSFHPLLPPSPPAPNLPQHQGLFQWVNSSHEVAKVLEFQLRHQSFQWTPRTDLL